MLLGGDPGIGKSTLLLQVAAQVAADAPVLYASGEESAEQIALRAQRLQRQFLPRFDKDSKLAHIRLVVEVVNKKSLLRVLQQQVEEEPVVAQWP